MATIIYETRHGHGDYLLRRDVMRYDVSVKRLLQNIFSPTVYILMFQA